MPSRFRLPMFVVAAALLALIVLLATLQYRWLGRISDAERERMTANLSAHSTAVAQDFDRELTRAYAAFQLEPIREDEGLAARLATRYERWLATARHPRLVRDVYVVTDAAAAELHRFSPTTRFVEPVGWPDALAPVRGAMQKHLAGMNVVKDLPSADKPGTFIVRATQTVWPEIPALVVAAPMFFFNSVAPRDGTPHALQFSQPATFVIVHLDRDYMTREMLPAILDQHFRAAGTAYQIAVVGTDDKQVIYTSDASFHPDPQTKVDASAEMFQVKPQEFGTMVSELRRLTTRPRGESTSIVVQQSLNVNERAAVVSGAAAAAGAAAARPPLVAPRWRLLVKHPSGSLEAAVTAARRRNLLVSFGVLALVGVSVGFLVVTTRRAQALAQQQMEFVAAVSHELRTPLAVIRSAADNLAEGVVHDDPQVRKYGDLMRGEGRRLTEMVEQILELAGIESGQRGFALRPVPVTALLHDTVRAASTLIDEAGLDVEFDVPESLPPVLGDEPALRRVFQNLVGNAVKYGAHGRWLGLKARASGRDVVISVADRGLGIPAAEQAKIFDPFYRSPTVVAAQIHGAGLGLSLVQRIVEAHGGRITVRSAEGQGSEFTVHLPAASEEPVTRPSVTPDVAQTHPSR